MHPPHCTDKPDTTLPARAPINNPSDNAFVDSSQTLHDEAESEGEEEPVVAAPAAKKRRAAKSLLFRLLWYLAVLKHVTQLPKGSTTGNNITHQGVATADSQKKETGESSKPMILWM